MNTPSKKVNANSPSRKSFKQRLDDFFLDVYKIYHFIRRFFKELFLPPYEWKEITKQSYQIGVNSLLLITLTGFIIGIVFTKQSRPSLENFGATSWLPSLVAIAIVRAMAPLVTALICAGKVGSNIGAELGSMRVTEQIDAMEVSATNPFKFLVVSRVLASAIMIPLLAVYNGFVCLLGAFLNVYNHEQTSFVTFFANVWESISLLDMFSSLLKTMLFGITLGFVGCYQGYYSSKGTEGVGKAANKAVVISMFIIFIEEIVVVSIVNSIR